MIPFPGFEYHVHALKSHPNEQGTHQVVEEHSPQIGVFVFIEGVFELDDVTALLGEVGGEGREEDYQGNQVENLRKEENRLVKEAHQFLRNCGRLKNDSVLGEFSLQQKLQRSSSQDEDQEDYIDDSHREEDLDQTVARRIHLLHLGQGGIHGALRLAWNCGRGIRVSVQLRLLALVRLVSI